MGNLGTNEAVPRHAFIFTEATGTESQLPFQVNKGILDFVNYGPGDLVIGFDRPIPDVLPPASTEIMVFSPTEGLPPGTPRKCDTLYFKCLTPGQVAKFKGVGV